MRELIIDGNTPRFKSGKETSEGLSPNLNSNQRAAVEKVQSQIRANLSRSLAIDRKRNGRTGNGVRIIKLV